MHTHTHTHVPLDRRCSQPASLRVPPPHRAALRQSRTIEKEKDRALDHARARIRELEALLSTTVGMEKAFCSAETGGVLRDGARVDVGGGGETKGGKLTEVGREEGREEGMRVAGAWTAVL
jgi:hypothetical protein